MKYRNININNVMKQFKRFYRKTFYYSELRKSYRVTQKNSLASSKAIVIDFAYVVIP